ncbi:alpha-L-rhamnosidase [Anaerocolumna jejuensis DSM 15929]|uniref:alpha-L-rhamnosidase n=1 Tax=Anaerocolumna jejuensis DSM 15929 TaxID=1121322 RepID=A0A1M7BUI4_9FIRM|nr:family 78 glycoside hydrolase catalytic domain [Anaerocolumna jejuensis]SHL58641.1 alpha-L-rhamnosidase [Anaerocolumna jejuensis DSM 15929]
MKGVYLRTEYLENPIGIDKVKPRFYWNCEKGTTQTAYQVYARFEDNTQAWNSGKTASSQMTHITYDGSPLKSRDTVFWKVKLWDQNGREGEWSEEVSFELGILPQDDWQAKWISGNYTPQKNVRYPVDCFSKKFTVDKVIKARLYVTACGIYEGRLNGKHIGNYVHAPGHTDYRKRIQYQVYDVLALLKEGENQLTFELADGWYRGSVGAWGFVNFYGNQTKLLAQLELTYADGKTTSICSNRSFAWSNDGPIRFADTKDGEKVDANMVPSYSGNAIEMVCDIVPCASNNFSIVEKEHFKPSVRKTPSGMILLDFKQNLAGYLKFNFHAKKGQKLFLQFGEMLDVEGEFTQKNIQCVKKDKRTPLQQVMYISKEGENTYKTKYASFGFRYVLVKSEVEIKAEDFTAIAVYSDMKETAKFKCSNALLNQFFESTMWSMKGNSEDVPTDCPTRERHGWTGDAQIFFKTAGYLMDYAPFAKKFIRDMTDRQSKNGKFHQIVPEGGEDPLMRTMNGSVGWADAGVLIPYRFWKLFGDEEILRENYDAMKNYARFMMKRCGKLGFLAKPLYLKGREKKYVVNCGQSYGEWAEPSDVWKLSWKDMASPHPEESTAYTHFVMKHMVEIARVLGKGEDCKIYQRYADGTKLAYQKLVSKKGFSLDTDRQAKLVRPLYMNLLNTEQEKYAKKRLIQAMESYSWRLGTGFLSTPFILYVLAEINIDYAYRLLENEEIPGWLSMPKNGATTIWENWEGDLGDQKNAASLNHYSKGACIEWVIEEMCGIHVKGENEFIIEPKPGGTITFAKAEYQSIYGAVISGWQKKEDQIVYSIRIPSNTIADILLPNGTKQTVKSGEYEYVQNTQI